jgi:hypothetical protein
MAGDWSQKGMPKDVNITTISSTYTSNTSNVGVDYQVWIGDPPPYWPDTVTVPSVMPDYQQWTQPSITPWYPTNPKEEAAREELMKKVQEMIEGQKEKKKEGLMKVYEVLVIDKKECKVLLSQTVIAKDKETAMLELDLTLDIKSRVKQNLVEFIFTEKGSFTKVERKVKIEELKEDE